MWAYPSQNEDLIVGKPAGHRDVAEGSVLCTPRWKLEREAEVKRRRGEEDRVV